MDSEKNITMRKYSNDFGGWNSVVKADKFIIQKAYRMIRGIIPSVPWKGIACYNLA